VRAARPPNKYGMQAARLLHNKKRGKNKILPRFFVPIKFFSTFFSSTKKDFIHAL
jgi:hypothetical protein